MRSVPRSLSFVLLAVLMAGAWAWNASAGVPTAAQIEQAVSRASAWVEAHPASLKDGGLTDLVDEAVLYLVLQGLAEQPEDQRRFAQTLRERVSAVDKLPEFGQWVRRPGKGLIDHYHLLLAAHLMQVAGQPSVFQDQIIEQAGQALADAPYAYPTFRLTIAALLRYLGGQPAVDRKRLFDASLIAQVASGRQPVVLSAPASRGQGQGTALQLYALVHEVVALTDFGRLRPCPWLARRRATLSRFIVPAAAWAKAREDVDLLSELLMTARLLGKPLRGSLDAEVAWLVAAQRPDGSWGPCSTARPNKKRHAVQTALAALWAYRNEMRD